MVTGSATDCSVMCALQVGPGRNGAEGMLIPFAKSGLDDPIKTHDQQGNKDAQYSLLGLSIEVHQARKKEKPKRQTESMLT